jgi:hypothetical protein
MSNTNTGGPAFPTQVASYEGMTLRDYFAAKAMQGLLSRIGHDKINVHDVLAQRTYQIADAMLKAREA